jgi:hypothetical protein
VKLKYIIKCFIGFLSLVVFIGCASTKPNTPYPGPYPSGFNVLAHKNPLLAEELGKLPELQDGISEEEAASLGKIVELYNDDPVAFEAAFNKMYKIGIPEVRKYCTPLQALFWLYEKEDHKPGEEINLSRYSLRVLLDQAWDFSDKSQWGNFKVVTSRLNAPELINFYAQRNFGYVPYGQKKITPQYIFKSKTGCCQDYTAFSVYCLKKGGYDARAITIKSPTGHSRNHVVCEYKGKDGKKYILDNSCNFCTGGRGIEEKEVYTLKFPQVGVGYW